MSERSLELQPPSKAMTMRGMMDFVDLAGVSWERFQSVVNARQNLDRAREGELVPHGKSVEQLEQEFLVLSDGVNMVRCSAALVFLRYRGTNPGLTWDDVLDMEPADFQRISRDLQQALAQNAEDEGEGEAVPLERVV